MQKALVDREHHHRSRRAPMRRLGWRRLVSLIVAATVAAGCSGERAVADTVVWDLSSPRAAASLPGGVPGSPEALLSSPGGNELDLEVALPGDVLIDRRWGLAAALDGQSGVVDRVELSTSPEQDRRVWEPYVEEFIDEFGADRSEVDRWLSEALEEVAAGRSVPQSSFDGAPIDGVLPSLSLRTGGGGPDPVDVVVEWRFDLIQQ